MSDPHDNPYAAPQAQLSSSPVPTPLRTATPAPPAYFQHPLILNPKLFWPIWSLLYLANCISPFILGLDVVRKSSSGIIAMLLGIISFYLIPSFLNYCYQKLRLYMLIGASIVGLWQIAPEPQAIAGLIAIRLCGVETISGVEHCSPIQAYCATIITGAELCMLALIIGRLIVSAYDSFIAIYKYICD